VFFSFIRGGGVKKVYYPPRRNRKIPQIYWVELGYFFSLSATAEDEEIPQINQRFFSSYPPRRSVKKGSRRLAQKNPADLLG